MTQILRAKLGNGTAQPIARKSVEKTDKTLKFPIQFNVRVAVATTNHLLKQIKPKAFPRCSHTVIVTSNP